MTEIFQIEREFCQKDFDNFAKLSGDFNPIHTDPQFAAKSGFGRTVAHGIFLYSILYETLIDKIGKSIIGVSKIKFPAPTFTNTPMLLIGQKIGDGHFIVKTVEKSSGQETCVVDIILNNNLVLELPKKHDSSGSGNLQIAQTITQERVFNIDDIKEYEALFNTIIKDDLVPFTLINASFSKILGIDIPGLGTNYLKQETQYIEHAKIDEILNTKIEIIGLRKEKKLVDLETICTGKGGRLIAIGRALVSARDVKGAF